MEINRRNAITGSAAAAVATVLPAQASAIKTERAASAEDRVVHHWRELLQALQEIAPADCRLQFSGYESANPETLGFQVVGFRKAREEVRPGLEIDVEHVGYHVSFDRHGWYRRLVL